MHLPSITDPNIRSHLLFFSAARDSLASFLEEYTPGRANETQFSSPLIFSAMRNPDPQNRFEIVQFLVREGADLTAMTESGETLFFPLFQAENHCFAQTEALLELLLNAGVSLAVQDVTGRTALHWLVLSSTSDDDLAECYDRIFAIPDLPFTLEDSWGFSPLSLAQKLPHRKALLARIEQYLAH